MSALALTALPPLAGGALIGAAASLLFLTHGRVAGISGIFGEALRKDDDQGVQDAERGSGRFRLSFLLGLLGTGLLLRWVWPTAFDLEAAASPIALVVAGCLVGFGTRLGGGCTSGHGVCGLSRLSWRSLVATLTFMAAGFVTVYVTHHLVKP